MAGLTPLGDDAVCWLWLLDAGALDAPAARSAPGADELRRGHAPTTTMISTLKSWLLFATIAALTALVGFVVAGSAGLLIGGALIAMLATVGPSASEALVMRLLGAVPLKRHHAPELFHVVDLLARRAGIRPPALFLAPSPGANAMAVRTQGDGALAVTRGALRLLGPAELEAVLAHEVAHLKNGDTEFLQLTAMVSRAALSLLRVGTWVAVLGVLVTGGGVARAGLIALLALLVPPVVGALHSALSRTRELVADQDAAALTGRPLALASALAKLEHHHHGWLRRLVVPEAPEWLRSHPSTRERVERLVELDRRLRFSA